MADYVKCFRYGRIHFGKCTVREFDGAAASMIKLQHKCKATMFLSNLIKIFVAIQREKDFSFDVNF